MKKILLLFLLIGAGQFSFAQNEGQMTAARKQVTYTCPMDPVYGRIELYRDQYFGFSTHYDIHTDYGGGITVT
jgi:hypothetical protein